MKHKQTMLKIPISLEKILFKPSMYVQVSLLQFCLEKIGVPIIGAIEAPGYLEGGDFFVAGRDLCMVGIGLRSNMEAVQQVQFR